jgi:apolipoprotein N-acyltransferase
MGLKPGDRRYRYDKHHLVPFGEFIPPLFKWFTRMMNIPLGDFNRGDVGQPSFAWQGQRLAPNICYEDLFGEELGARFIDPAGRRPSSSTSATSAGSATRWRSTSTCRSAACGRWSSRGPMIRATNTGATAIIDRLRRGHARAAALHPRRAGGRGPGRPGITPSPGGCPDSGCGPCGALALIAALPLPGLRRAGRSPKMRFRGPPARAEFRGRPRPPRSLCSHSSKSS